MEKTLKNIASGSTTIFTGRIFNAGAQYLLLLILGRYLGAADVGLFVLGRAVIQFCGVGGTLGFTGSVQKFIPEYLVRKQHGKVPALIKFAVSSVFLTSLFLGILIYVLADHIGIKIFSSEPLVSVLKLFAFSLPIYGLLMVLLASIRSLGDMTGFSLIENILFPSGILVISIFLFTVNLHVFSAIAAFFASILIATIIAVFFLKKDLPNIQNRNSHLINKGKIIKYSLPLMGTGIIGFFLMWTDTFMLGMLRTTEDVGIYNGATRIALFSNIALTSVNAAFGPTISKLYSQGDIKKLSNVYKTTVKWMVHISLPLYLIIFIFAEYIMSLYGPSFVRGSVPLIILSIGQIVNVSMGSAGYLLNMTGRPRVEFINTAASVSMNVLLNYFLIPVMGITGAALATAISLSFINILRALENYLYLQIHPFSLQLIWPFAARVQHNGLERKY